ncbi:MAG: class I SAM-dependent methyltransferase [Cyclobacteriaceae bacterium]|nr:class I SAM-dependent methyltransferase [Cyclobacteriaceae bacterium]
MKNYLEASNINKSFYVKKNLVATPSCFSLPYLKYRLLRPFLKLYTKFLLRKYNPAPWTSPASVNIFDQLLTKDMTGLEYGSGRSTLFFAERLGKLTSIEHHEGWYNQVVDLLKKHNINNTEYKLVKPGELCNQDWPFYEKFNITPKGLHVKSRYKEYFEIVNAYPDEYFDFVLIDGRARTECALNAIPKVKKQGMLVLDNSERSRYKPIFNVLKDWPVVKTTNGLTDTTIWFKP